MADLPPSPTTTPTPWWAVIGLVYILILIFAAALLVVLWKNLEDKYLQIFSIALIGFVGTGLGYYFGSSSGSDKKDHTIATNNAVLTASLPAAMASDAAKELARKLPNT